MTFSYESRRQKFSKAASQAHDPIYRSEPPGDKAHVAASVGCNSPSPRGKGPGCTAIELSHSPNESAVSSPSPPLEERVGERRPFNAAPANSTAVGSG